MTTKIYTVSREISTHTQVGITLHKGDYFGEAFWYWQCEGHGEGSEEFDSLARAKELSRDSRDWCPGCGEGWAGEPVEVKKCP